MINSNTIINIGVLGIAAIANKNVIPAIIDSPDLFKLSGLASRDMSKATAYANLYNCKAFGSYEELIKDITIDAVYIPLPNSLHYPFVKKAIENRKHVIVEKSLGLTVAEVKEMVDLAKKYNLVLLENFQFRFHSQLKTIQKILLEGVIGDLRSVRVSFGFPPFTDSSNIRYNPNLGGGALLDAGAYAFKIAPYFLGKEVFVSQGSMGFDPVRNVDIWGQGVIQQINGALCCQFAYGFDHHYQCSLELWGSKGKLTTNRIFTAPIGYQPKLMVETKNQVEELILPADNHFKNMLEYFFSLIKGSSLVTEEYEQNIKQSKLIDEFRKMHNK
jgi:NDP-hexose-3-ketoreductase